MTTLTFHGGANEIGGNKMLSLFKIAARRAVHRGYRYFNFRGNEISEPEMRHVLTKVLEEKRIYYAIEVRTKEKFNKDSHRALFDLAIYSAHHKLSSGYIKPEVVIEFKRAQPQKKNPYEIRKDFIKMLKEPCKGACFFHLLTGTRKKSVNAHNAILKKYQGAFNTEKNKEYSQKWFLLFILDCNQGKYFEKRFDDMLEFNVANNEKKWRNIK